MSVNGRAKTDAQTWRVGLAGQVSAALLVCLWLGLSIGITVGGGAGSGVPVILWVATFGIGVGVWRAAYIPYIKLGPRDVVIQNRIAHHSISYVDIMSVQAGYDGITVYRRDGTCNTAWAVQKSSFMRWRHKTTRADRVVDEILARLPA